MSLGRTLLAALVVLTLTLAVFAALGLAELYDARQRYDDTLASTYRLEAAASRLESAAVIEVVALGQGAGAARRARAGFSDRARETLRLARPDRPSTRLVRSRLAAQRRWRRLARSGSSRGVRSAIVAGRSAGRELTDRQAERRRAARETAADESRDALLETGLLGGLALLAVLGIVVALVTSIRRPLDSLVGATRRLAEGNLGERVEPGGPQELTALGGAFNTMAEQLGGAQQRIEDERRKLEVTIESLGDALVVCDENGIVTAVNRRAGELAPSLTPGESIKGDRLLPELEAALAGEVMREHGERTLAITASRLGGPDGGVVWTLRDVSERARLERVKSDFVATASHELRSPLTSIKGFVELLSRSEGVGEREREFVDVILESTDRLVDLVNDLLDVARLDAGKMDVHPRLFDVGEVVREVSTLMAPRIEAKTQRLDVRVPPMLPRALADPVRVRQIVTNLLSNAHEYTEEGGRLTVSVRPDHASLAIAVSDTGRGMSPELQERVFERFVRREDGSGGTGLGLSIVKSLVELQGGSIHVESEPGSGSTFTVRLPAEPQTGQAGAARGAIRGKRVLVVDDEPDVARLIAEQLRGYDVQTEVAHSADEALELLRREQFDAMTLDVLMPGKTGIDLLGTLREDSELDRIAVVVVSILAGTEALFGEWKVTKPIAPEELADVLGAAVLAGRTRVLVVGRSALRDRLEPALVRLGLDHEWVTSATAAGQACASRRYEVALVDAGMRSPGAAVKALDLRGRRAGRAVVLFSSGDDAPEVASLDAERAPIEEAANAVLATLGRDLDGEPV